MFEQIETELAVVSNGGCAGESMREKKSGTRDMSLIRCEADINVGTAATHRQVQRLRRSLDKVACVLKIDK